VGLRGGLAAGEGDQGRAIGRRHRKVVRQPLGDLDRRPPLVGLQFADGDDRAPHAPGQRILGQIERAATPVQPAPKRDIRVHWPLLSIPGQASWVLPQI
jgi:hypothetical protein